MNCQACENSMVEKVLFLMGFLFILSLYNSGKECYGAFRCNFRAQGAV